MILYDCPLEGAVGPLCTAAPGAALHRCDADFHEVRRHLFFPFFFLFFCVLRIRETNGAILSALSKLLRHIRINMQHEFSLIVPCLSDEITQVATVTTELKSVSRSSGDAAGL